MKNSTRKIIEYKRRNPIHEDEYYGFSEEEKLSFIIPVFRFVEWSGFSGTTADETMRLVRGQLKFSITISNGIGWSIVTNEVTGMDMEDVARKSVQGLLNHDVRIIPMISAMSEYPKGEVDYSKMRYDFSDAPEPWKTFFEQLFMDSSWTFDRPMIEMKTKIE